jgi:hypothetical protein
MVWVQRHPALLKGSKWLTIQDWSLKNCQDYLVELQLHQRVNEAGKQQYQGRKHGQSGVILDLQDK